MYTYTKVFIFYTKRRHILIYLILRWNKKNKTLWFIPLIENDTWYLKNIFDVGHVDVCAFTKDLNLQEHECT